GPPPLAEPVEHLVSDHEFGRDPGHRFTSGSRRVKGAVVPVVGRVGNASHEYSSRPPDSTRPAPARQAKRISGEKNILRGTRAGGTDDDPVHRPLSSWNNDDFPFSPRRP